MPSFRVIRATVAGTLVGGATGFVLGLLVAPTEGQAVRRRVVYLLSRWTGEVSGLLDRLDSAQEESEARTTGAALVAEAREQAEQLLSEADALMREVRRTRDSLPPHQAQHHAEVPPASPAVRNGEPRR